MIYVIIGIIVMIAAIGIFYYKHFKKLKELCSTVQQKEKQLEEINNQISDATEKEKGLLIEIRDYENDVQYVKGELKNQLQQIELAKKDHDNLIAAIKDKQLYLNEYCPKQEEIQRELLESKAEILRQQYDKEMELYKQYIATKRSELENDYNTAADKIHNEIFNLTCTYAALAEAIKKSELDNNQKLYYTVQIPIEFQDDISYLLNETAAKIKHPDVINKLIWTEYVKPRLDETFKRLDITDVSGIYKLTSTIDGKAYIGKSVNVKKRLAEHFKGALGISTIADQVIHHAMREQGIQNWMIEILEYCDKDKISEREKFYIDLLQTEVVGYNKKAGG